MPCSTDPWTVTRLRSAWPLRPSLAFGLVVLAQLGCSGDEAAVNGGDEAAGNGSEETEVEACEENAAVPLATGSEATCELNVEDERITLSCSNGIEIRLVEGTDAGACCVTVNDGDVAVTCKDEAQWHFASDCSIEVEPFRWHDEIAAECPGRARQPLGIVVHSPELKPPDWPPERQLVGGSLYVCGLTEEGEAVCWGDEVLEPLNLDEEGSFVQLAPGGSHRCGLRPDGSVRCWGRNTHGQLDVDEQEVFVQLAAGGRHTCGLRPDGSARCWGRNDDGQADTDPSAHFVKLVAGDQHTCGLRPDGFAVCWGRDHVGQVSETPNEPFAQLYAGEEHMCGLRADGSARCWGDVLYRGEVAEEFVQLIASSINTCGLRPDGSAYCWSDGDLFGENEPRPPLRLSACCRFSRNVRALRPKLQRGPSFARSDFSHRRKTNLGRDV